MNVTILYEPRRLHPLAWIHRAEARSIAAELRGAGHSVKFLRYHAGAIGNLPAGPLLLRVSDPLMLTAARALTRAARPYLGPSAAVMERCYDKYEAHRIATANGVDCPATKLANQAVTMPFPLMLKPRRGSDSIGVRLLRHGPIPARAQTDEYLIQRYIDGFELTVAVYRGHAGTPLRIFLPEGTPYSFARKYLLRPRRTPLTDAGLAERVRREALEIARIFKVDWAARIDVIHEKETGRLRLLECDVAPLVGANSAFAASFAAAGVRRADQLRMLLYQNDDET